MVGPISMIFQPLGFSNGGYINTQWWLESPGKSTKKTPMIWSLHGGSPVTVCSKDQIQLTVSHWHHHGRFLNTYLPFEHANLSICCGFIRIGASNAKKKTASIPMTAKTLGKLLPKGVSLFTTISSDPPAGKVVIICPCRYCYKMGPPNYY